MCLSFDTSPWAYIVIFLKYFTEVFCTNGTSWRVHGISGVLR